MRQNIDALSLKRFEMKFNKLPNVIICVKLYLGSQGAFRGSGKTTGQMPAPVWEDHCLLWISFLRKWKLRFVCFFMSSLKKTKITIIFKGNCADNSTGHAKLYLKSQVKVTKDFQDYTFLRWAYMPKKTIESQNKKPRFSAWLQRLGDTLVSFLASLSWTPRTFSKSFVLLAKIFSHGDLLRQGLEYANCIKTKTNELCKSQTFRNFKSFF